MKKFLIWFLGIMTILTVYNITSNKPPLYADYGQTQTAIAQITGTADINATQTAVVHATQTAVVHATQTAIAALTQIQIAANETACITNAQATATSAAVANAAAATAAETAGQIIASNTVTTIYGASTAVVILAQGTGTAVAQTAVVEMTATVTFLPTSTAQTALTAIAATKTAIFTAQGLSITAANTTATQVETANQVQATQTQTIVDGVFTVTCQGCNSTATVIAQSTANAQATQTQSVFTLTSTITPTNTPTNTPTIVGNNGVYFHPTPWSGKINLAPTPINNLLPWQNNKYIKGIGIDSMKITSTAIDIYNGTTFIRHVEIYSIPMYVTFSGSNILNPVLDMKKNTGTATLYTQSNSGENAYYAPVTYCGNISLITTSGVRVDKITIDSLDNTPATVNIEDGTSVVDPVEIFTVPVTVPLNGYILTTALKINYGNNTGTASAWATSNQGLVSFQATPIAGQSGTIISGKHIDEIWIDSAVSTPCAIYVYDGSVLLMTKEILTTPAKIEMGGVYVSTLILNSNGSAYTSKTFYRP